MLLCLLPGNRKAFTVPYLQDTMQFNLYSIFGGFCVLMAAFTFYFIPETASKSLEESHGLFETDRANRSKGNRGTGETDPLLVNQ